VDSREGRHERRNRGGGGENRLLFSKEGVTGEGPTGGVIEKWGGVDWVGGREERIGLLGVPVEQKDPSPNSTPSTRVYIEIHTSEEWVNDVQTIVKSILLRNIFETKISRTTKTDKAMDNIQ